MKALERQRRAVALRIASEKGKITAADVVDMATSLEEGSSSKIYSVPTSPVSNSDTTLTTQTKASPVHSESDDMDSEYPKLKKRVKKETSFDKIFNWLLDTSSTQPTIPSRSSQRTVEVVSKNGQTILPSTLYPSTITLLEIFQQVQRYFNLPPNSEWEFLFGDKHLSMQLTLEVIFATDTFIRLTLTRIVKQDFFFDD